MFKTEALIKALSILMKRKSIVITIISMLLIMIFVQLRSFYKLLKTPDIKIEEAVPDSCALIVKVASINSFLNADASLKSLYNSLFINEIKHILHSDIDTIILKNLFFTDIIKKRALLKCYVKDHNNDTQNIYLLSINKIKQKHALTNFLKLLKLTNKNAAKLTFDNDFYYKIRTLQNIEFYFFIKNNIVAISFSENLIKKTITSIIKPNNDFENGIGRFNIDYNSKLSFFIDNQIFIKTFFNKKFINIYELDSSNSYTKYDLYLRQNVLLLTGSTLFKNNENSSSIDNNKIDISQNLGKDCAFYRATKINNISNYLKNNKINDTTYLKSNTNDYVFRTKEELSLWFDNQIYTLYFDDFFINNSAKCATIIKVTNTFIAKERINYLLTSEESNIYQLKVDFFIQKIFGNKFANQNYKYVSFLNNEIIFSPTKNIIKHIIQYKSDDYKNYNYKILTQFATFDCSFYLYFKPQIILKPHKSVFLKSAKAAFVQLKNNNNYCNNNLAILLDTTELKHIETFIQPNIQNADTFNIKYFDPLEEYSFIGIVTINHAKENNRQGQTVDNSKIIKFTNANGFAIINDNLNVSFKSNTNKTLFDVKLNNVPLHIEQIKKTDSNEQLFLAITNYDIYLLDLKGIVINKVKLSNPIEKFVSVFDYDKNNTYRIIYQTINNELINVDIYGRALKDWNVVKTKNKLSQPPIFIRVNGKDYIFTIENSGVLTAFDRKANVRINIDAAFSISQNAGIYINRTNNKGFLITASKSGKLAYISEKGIVSYSDFNISFTDPFFTYFDFNEDGSNDFVFSSNSEVIIFDKMKNILKHLKKDKANFEHPIIYNKQNVGALFVRDKNNNDLHYICINDNYNCCKNIKCSHNPFVISEHTKSQLVTYFNNNITITDLECK